MRWAGHVANMREMRNAYSTLVRTPERKRPLGNLGHRWEDNSSHGGSMVLTTLHHNPKGHNLNLHYHENFKSHMVG
jgi:hypothetical protein